MELNEYQRRAAAGFHTLDHRPCPACGDLDGCHLPAKIRTGKAGLMEFWQAHALWSQATFGRDDERGPAGPLKHLAKEVQETLASPADLEEYADLLFLTLDATRRAGFTLDQLLAAAWSKLDKNQRRKWQAPTADEPVEHDRSEDRPCST